MNDARTVIVLAAGMGKRMHSTLPKMLHPLLGRPLVGHVLAATRPLGAAQTLVVVGSGAEQVTDYVQEAAPGARTVLQEVQHGTGHATRIAMEAAPEVDGTVIVVYGDTPLLRTETLDALLTAHAATGAAATVLSGVVPDPFGFGRIIRDVHGNVVRIVEQRDASVDEAAICEINSGIYAFRADLLREMLGKLSSDNDQGEELLTDVIGLLISAGYRVDGRIADDPDEALGCNDRAQLADLGTRMRDRINGDLMRSGVTMLDPATTWIDVTVTVDIDAVIEPNTQLRGSTSIGGGALVGPDTTLTDVTVGAKAQVVRTHGSSAVIGAGASVGPFAFLRPGTVLDESGKIGTFVETKNSRIGRGSKVPHLTYVGDATIGEHVNVGAGTIFANYDGLIKSPTRIDDAAFIGSGTTLIAPVTIGAGAYVGGGSAVNEDVPPGALGIARARQRNIDGWTAKKRPGTRSAAAAEVANDEKS
ncbi:MAG TPA: bifunctional UDP-N-acetylglucosamine diphosphorylase/glucosamine-1-phosphate N-acetyltransferase GlmU [Micromonosporaceae bacterium]|jgi:bifunctional UDP-N-acetylglucosamine pyrophosphorylase/glucosamine-1-phosphate N-acetyltransferase